MFRRVDILPVVMALVFASSCGGSSSTAPTPPPSQTPPPPAPPPSTQWSLSGRVVDVSTGAPVPGAVLEPAGFERVTAASDGTFSFQHLTWPQYSPYLVTVRAEGYITRDAQVLWQRGARTGVDISLIRDAPPFSLAFYRELVRNAMEQPDNLYWLRRWTKAPHFYVRTIDEDAGRAVEPEVLETVLEWLPRGVAMWTGWPAPIVEVGPEPRADRVDWIRVVFERQASNFCGTSFVGRNPGVITLSLDSCDCGSRKVPPHTIVHEIGHALGFWHVSDRQSVMFPTNPGGCRPAELSAAETFHAAIAFQRGNNSRDIDADDNQTGFSRPIGFDPDVLVVD